MAPLRLVFLLLLLTPTHVGPVFAQGAAEPGHGATSPEQDAMFVAPVVIDGGTLFSVRGISAYPATRRAEEVRARIEALAADRSVPATAITVEERAGTSEIRAGALLILTVFEDDARLDQLDRQLLARAFANRIRESVETWRRERDPARLWRHAFYALVATLALLVAAFLGRRIVTALRAALERRYHARIRTVEIQAFQVVKAEQIWRLLIGVLNLAWGFGMLAIVYLYLQYVLTLFPWTRALGTSLLALVTEPLKTLGLGLMGAIPNLVFLAILVLVTRYLLKIVRIFFESVDRGTVKLRDFDAEWAWPTYRLVRLFAVALAIVVAYPYIPGSNSDAFKGVSLFVGVIFSLGSSSLIANLIAGYSMTYRRAFRTGDRVQIGDHIGDVERMRLLVTHLRTPKNEEVVVPNSTILGAAIVNYSSMARERGLILHTTVGIGYETPWRQVEAMLIEAAARTPGVVRQPEPFVLQKALGDFCITYEINVYCDTPQAMARIYADLHRNLLDLFNEYGVQIMTPAYEGDPEQPKVVPKDQWYAAPARPPDTQGGLLARSGVSHTPAP